MPFDQLRPRHDDPNLDEKLTDCSSFQFEEFACSMHSRAELLVEGGAALRMVGHGREVFRVLHLSVYTGIVAGICSGNRIPPTIIGGMAFLASREIMARIVCKECGSHVEISVSSPTADVKKKRHPACCYKVRRKLTLCRIRNPDFYDKAVAALSEKDATFVLDAADIEPMDDSRLMKKMKCRPGVVFWKPAALKRDWEAR